MNAHEEQKTVWEKHEGEYGFLTFTPDPDQPEELVTLEGEIVSQFSSTNRTETVNVYGIILDLAVNPDLPVEIWVPYECIAAWRT